MNTAERQSVFTENRKSIIMLGVLRDEKMAAVNILIARMLVYSAIKINANGPLLYSVLNPETSSDSPSAKSNGVRFVSANIVINQIRVIGSIIIVGQERFMWVACTKLNVWIINSADKRINDILTS
jgi:hypothetical protein